MVWNLKKKIEKKTLNLKEIRIRERKEK